MVREGEVDGQNFLQVGNNIVITIKKEGKGLHQQEKVCEGLQRVKTGGVGL